MPFFRRRVDRVATLLLITLGLSACGEADRLVSAEGRSGFPPAGRTINRLAYRSVSGWRIVTTADLQTAMVSDGEQGASPEQWRLADGSRDIIAAWLRDSARSHDLLLPVVDAATGTSRGTVALAVDAQGRLTRMTSHSGLVETSLRFTPAEGSDGVSSVETRVAGDLVITGDVADDPSVSGHRADEQAGCGELECGEEAEIDIATCLMAILDAVAAGLVTGAALAGAAAAFEAGQVWLGRILLAGALGALWQTSSAIVRALLACGIRLPGTGGGGGGGGVALMAEERPMIPGFGEILLPLTR